MKMFEGKKVHEVVRDALHEQQETIAGLARKLEGVDRVFLGRILNTHGVPPRARGGRKYAKEDPRYTCLAEALGLDPDEFCALVEKEQRAQVADAIPDLYQDLKPYLLELRMQIARRLIQECPGIGVAMFFAAWEVLTYQTFEIGRAHV